MILKDIEALGVGKADREIFNVPEYADGWNSLIDIIEKAPTVEAEPVIHAHWVKMSDPDGLYYCCGNCGEDLPRYYTERPTFDNPFPDMESIDKTPRCPNCGAVMDK